MPSTTASDGQTCNHGYQSQYRVGEDNDHPCGMLERALVEIWTVGLLEFFLSCKPEQCQGEQEHDEDSADSSSIGDDHLRFSEKQNYNDDWDRYYCAPDALYDFSLVL